MDRPLTDAPPVGERRIQAAAVTTTLVGNLPVFLTGAMAVQIGRDLTLGPTRLGLASGAFFAAAAAGSALMGRLAERVGPTLAMRGAAATAGVVLALESLAPSFELLVLCLVAGGLTNALAQVASNLLIARCIDPLRQGWSLALKQAAVPAATLLGGLAVPLLAVTVGWRWAYAAATVVAVAALVLVPGGVVAPGGRNRERRRGDVPLGPLVLLASAAAAATLANGSLATFVVSAGVDAGLGESAAGLVLTGGSAAGLSMRLLAGARADRRGGRHLPVVSALLLGGTVGYLLLAPGTVVTHLLGALVAFGSGWAWPGLFNLAVVRLNPGAPAAATGITQTGVYLGALVGPIVFGVVVDASGYGTAWLLAAGASALASAGVLLGRRRVVTWRNQG